jgi:5-methylcytosine-specific restriction endonuclease McrA
MPARRLTRAGDPALKGRAWEAIKAYWRDQLTRDTGRPCEATRCLLPNVPIRITGPRGPDSLDVGHIVLRDLDDRTTWTPDDTRPEHQRCNRSAGAHHANAKRGTATRRPATAARW